MLLQGRVHGKTVVPLAVPGLWTCRAGMGEGARRLLTASAGEKAPGEAVTPRPSVAPLCWGHGWPRRRGWMGHAWPREEMDEHSLRCLASPRRGCCRPLGVPTSICSTNISIRLEYLGWTPAAEEDTESQGPEMVFLLITPSRS